MRCRSAKRDMILFAGGDLDERNIQKLLSHLNRCSCCAAEFETIKRSQALVQKIGRKDIPDPLPSDFSRKIYARAREEREKHSRPLPLRKADFQWKPAMAITGIIIALLTVLGLSQVFRKEPVVSHDMKARTNVEQTISEFAWTGENGQIAGFEGPFRLDTWHPPVKAGIFAIMHRADTENGGGVYTIDYCGETGDFSSCRRYPWMHHRKKRFISRAGSSENLYIAVNLLPEASKQDRRAMEKALIEKFNPYFNRKGV